MSSFREFLKEALKLKKGDKVIIKDGKKHDALKPTGPIEGTFMYSSKDKLGEFYVVKVGTGSMSVRPEDIK